MKFISWNVNGLRAVFTKGFPDIIKELDADFVCLQETKMQAGQLDADLPGYISYWNYAVKKGYSGTRYLYPVMSLSASATASASRSTTKRGASSPLEYPRLLPSSRCTRRIRRMTSVASTTA